MVADLIALITDAPACAARMAELQAREQKVAKGEAALAAAREQHERTVAKERGEHDARETRLRERAEKLSAAEGLLAHREKSLEERKRILDRRDHALDRDLPEGGLTRSYGNG
jgi:septal ring factor EnvC (AmiA/AmiB activator)